MAGFSKIPVSSPSCSAVRTQVAKKESAPMLHMPGTHSVHSTMGIPTTACICLLLPSVSPSVQVSSPEEVKNNEHVMAFHTFPKHAFNNCCLDCPPFSAPSSSSPATVAPASSESTGLGATAHLFLHRSRRLEHCNKQRLLW